MAAKGKPSNRRDKQEENELRYPSEEHDNFTGDSKKKKNKKKKKTHSNADEEGTVSPEMQEILMQRLSEQFQK